MKTNNAKSWAKVCLTVLAIAILSKCNILLALNSYCPGVWTSQPAQTLCEADYDGDCTVTNFSPDIGYCSANSQATYGCQEYTESQGTYSLRSGSCNGWQNGTCQTLGGTTTGPFDVGQSYTAHNTPTCH